VGVGAGVYMYDVVVKTFTFTISSTDEFLYFSVWGDTVDEVTHDTFCDNRFTDFGIMTSQLCHYPLTWLTVALTYLLACYKAMIILEFSVASA